MQVDAADEVRKSDVTVYLYVLDLHVDGPAWVIPLCGAERNPAASYLI